MKRKILQQKYPFWKQAKMQPSMAKTLLMAEAELISPRAVCYSEALCMIIHINI